MTCLIRDMTYPEMTRHISECMRYSSCKKTWFAHVWLWRHALINNVSHSWHDSFISDLIYSVTHVWVWNVPQNKSGSFPEVWLLGGLTHTYATATWLIFIRDTTHPCLTWLICKWHDSCMRDVLRARRGFACVISLMIETCHLRMSHVLHESIMSHMNEAWHWSMRRAITYQ